jgi:hypothetical protein
MTEGLLGGLAGGPLDCRPVKSSAPPARGPAEGADRELLVSVGEFG